VTGDADRLQQIVWNLLSNAVRFTPSGGQVAVSVARTGSLAEITVRDTGEGIDPAFIPHAFDRFRQADSTPARRHGGLGLGLAIVRHLVDAHGGTVQASSPGRGQGATFVVRLPVRAVAPRSAASPIPVVAAPEIAGTRVLVVDDEPDARELIRFVLESHQAVVNVAASAGAALYALGRETFDVLIADIGMPEQDGYALIRTIRTLTDGRARLPAIAVTAYASLRERELSRAAGYDYHLAKPVDPKQLVATIASARYARSRPAAEQGAGETPAPDTQSPA
jgi:hypothetical protein